ncbi:unnamed protein product [Leuciscus chuanchicus]
MPMRTWIRVDPRRLAYILGIPRMPRWERGIGSPFWFTHLPPTRHRPQNHEPQRFDSVIEESEDTQKDRQNSKEDENHRNRVRGQRDITGLVSRLESCLLMHKSLCINDNPWIACNLYIPPLAHQHHYVTGQRFANKDISEIIQVFKLTLTSPWLRSRSIMISTVYMIINLKAAS